MVSGNRAINIAICKVAAFATTEDIVYLFGEQIVHRIFGGSPDF